MLLFRGTEFISSNSIEPFQNQFLTYLLLKSTFSWKVDFCIPDIFFTSAYDELIGERGDKLNWQWHFPFSLLFKLLCQLSSKHGRRQEAFSRIKSSQYFLFSLWEFQNCSLCSGVRFAAGKNNFWWWGSIYDLPECPMGYIVLLQWSLNYQGVSNRDHRKKQVPCVLPTSALILKELWIVIPLPWDPPLP